MSDDADQTTYYTMRAKQIAAAVIALLDEYEAGHPKEAPCFITVLDGMKQVLA